MSPRRTGHWLRRLRICKSGSRGYGRHYRKRNCRRFLMSCGIRSRDGGHRKKRNTSGSWSRSIAGNGNNRAGGVETVAVETNDHNEMRDVIYNIKHRIVTIFCYPAFSNATASASISNFSIVPKS